MTGLRKGLSEISEQSGQRRRRKIKPRYSRAESCC